MIIQDETCKDRFRRMRRCEYCRKPVPACDPAHIFARGLDNGNQVDVAENLVGLCRGCHQSSHNGGHPNRTELLEIAATREQTTPEAIREYVWLIRRLPKGAEIPNIRRVPKELDSTKMEGLPF